MDLSSFKYKRRCSIFKDLVTKDEDLETTKNDLETSKDILHGSEKTVLNNNRTKLNISKHSTTSKCYNGVDTGRPLADSLETKLDCQKICRNSSELTSDESTSFEKDHTDFRLEMLKGVFKDAFSDDVLLDVATDTNGLDHAVSVLLDSKTAESSSKGGIDRDQNGSQSSACRPPKSRKRLASGEASPVELSGHETSAKHPKLVADKDILTKPENTTDDNKKCHILITDSFLTKRDELKKLKKLKKLFPGHEDQELLNVLECNDGCLDDAIAAMEAFSSPKKTMHCGTKQKHRKQKQTDVVVIDDNDEGQVLENSISNGTTSKAIIISDNEDQACSDSSEQEYPLMSNHEKDEVLSLLDSSEVAEIALVKGCSLHKAKKICSLRPFTNWNDLIEKFQKTKGLSEEIIRECCTLVNERNKIEHLMEQCEIISRDIQGLFAVKPSGSEHPPASEMPKSQLMTKEQYLTTEPRLVAPGFKLKPYQLTGLNWLIAIHKKDVNGILADEMGLGKTIQAIVFLAHLIEQGQGGPHLIIVPASTYDNWKRELEQWCPSIRYILYNGSQDQRKDIRDEIIYENEHDFQILLTTYNMAISSLADRSFLRKLQFHYAVFDEGHMLKNMKSQRYQSLLRIRPRRMLLLTGTPVQNNILELMSLLAFIMPTMFAEQLEGIKLLFGDNKLKLKEETAYQKEKVIQAKRIMEPFVLRRLKKDVLSQLPEKYDHLVECELPSQQMKVYNETFASCSKIIDSQDACSGLGLCIQLRKAANHPLMQRNYYDDDKLYEMAQRYCKDPSHRDSEANLVFEDMQVMSDFELSRLCLKERNLKDYELPDEIIMESGKFIYLDSVLPDMKKKGDRVLLFNQFTMMMDIFEVYLQTRRHNYLRLDGSTPVAERQNLIDKFDTEKDIFIFLLSTKAGGLGINLTSANVVILYDLDFNPHNDKQAEDRCHRLGQTRDVNVYRLISKETIEEAILKCTKDKMRLHEDISQSKEGNKSSDKDDIQTLVKAVFGRH